MISTHPVERPDLPPPRPSAQRGVLTGLYAPQPRVVVIAELVSRVRRDLTRRTDADRVALLEDALYAERKRLGGSADDARAPGAGGGPAEHAALDRLARALVRGDPAGQIDAALELVAEWADEIHGRFDRRVYGLATRILPRALTGLLSRRPDRLRDWTRSSNSRLRVEGDLGLLRDLAREATLILVPTHVSNLDSPLVGLALHLAGLPPFVYGAGLNLFSNPVMGWWMHRLGAYTVDRSKRALLYKEVLKAYSVRALTTRHHSLFFPGGTRSRSGEVETHLKKGLLGTGIVAWQEMLESGRPDPDVYVVPLTLSSQLVLEADTLIEDHLAEVGKQRYIITDDESAQPRRMAAFARRVLDLDASVVAHFGDPLDLVGNAVPVDRDARREVALRRRRYVTGADGRVEWDAQRDRVYTDRLSDAIVSAYPRYAWVMSTHLAARAAWDCLADASDTRDHFRLVRLPLAKRHIPVGRLTERLDALMARIEGGVRDGRWHSALPATADAVLAAALDRFGSYHHTRALARVEGDIVVEDPRLCLYYQNRLAYLSADEPGRP